MVRQAFANSAWPKINVPVYVEVTHAPDEKGCEE